MKFEFAPSTVRAGLIGGAVQAVLVIIGNLVGLLACILTPVSIVLPFAVGAYSVMLGRQAGRPAGNTQQDLVDGGLAGVISGAIGAIISAIFIFLGVGTAAVQSGDAAAGAAGMGFAAIAVVGGVCGGIVFGAILGAVGALIYSLLVKK